MFSAASSSRTDAKTNRKMRGQYACTTFSKSAASTHSRVAISPDVAVGSICPIDELSSSRVDAVAILFIIELMKRLRIAIIIALGIPAYVSAQAPTAVPDLNGVWQAPYTPNLAQVLGHELPYTPYGLQRAKTVDFAKDPTGLCLTVGPARAIQSPLPFQIVHTPNVVMLAFEYQRTFRMIYTDGTRHPNEIQDNFEFMGHSTGKWEGDTLVVDTVGIDDRTWLDTGGHEHSDKLHLTERFQKSG